MLPFEEPASKVTCGGGGQFIYRAEAPMCERTSRVVPVGVGVGAATGTDRKAEATGRGRKASYRQR